MFTGIIDHKGVISSVDRQGDVRIVITCEWNDFQIGESIAVNGVCLTVVASEKNTFVVDVSSETISRTAPRWENTTAVNLERALKMGDALSGHMVSGHVDGLAKLVEIKISGDSHIWILEAPLSLSRFIAEKGSITLDGVSLTVNKVENNRFWVNLIPHTFARTTFSARKIGDTLNLEIDLIARYVERLLGKA